MGPSDKAPLTKALGIPSWRNLGGRLMFLGVLIGWTTVSLCVFAFIPEASCE
jgi:hypothetical protein